MCAWGLGGDAGDAGGHARRDAGHGAGAAQKTPNLVAKEPGQFKGGHHPNTTRTPTEHDANTSR